MTTTLEVAPKGTAGIAVFVVLVAFQSPGRLADAQDLAAELRPIVTAYVSAVNSGDAETLASWYLATPDVATLGSGILTQGVTEVRQVLESYAASGLYMTVTSDKYQVLSATSFAAFLSFHLITSGGAPSGGGVMSVVFVLRDERWFVAHDHVSSPVPVSRGPLTSWSGSAGLTLDLDREHFDSGLEEPDWIGDECVVTRVVDGDTIACEELGSVRLLGIDAPESDQAPFGQQATEILLSMTPPGSV